MNERLVKAFEPFATQHLCLDCLQGIGGDFLAIISQLPSNFAALVEKARRVTVILQPAYYFRYIGYHDITASFRKLCRRLQPSVVNDFTHVNQSVLDQGVSATWRI